MDRSSAVRLAHLPGRADSSRAGAEDHFAAGHASGELAETFRPFDAADLAAERLTRGPPPGHARRPRADVLGRLVKGTGGHGSRDVFDVLGDLAPDRGKLDADGLRVRGSRRKLARLAKVGSRTPQKAIDRLEKTGIMYRVTERAKAEVPGRSGRTRSAT